MAKVRFLGHEPHDVPELGRAVQPDEVVTVPDERFDGYVCQTSLWESVEEPTTAAPAKKSPAKSSTTKGGND